MFIASIAGIAAFSLDGVAWATTHVVLTILDIMLLAFVDPCLRALASERMPPHWQGRSFGLVASLTGVGRLAANLVATNIFENVTTWSLPLAASSAPLCVSAMVLWVGVAALAVGRCLSADSTVSLSHPALHIQEAPSTDTS